MIRIVLGNIYSNQDEIIVVTLTLCEILSQDVQSMYSWISAVGNFGFYLKR